MLKIKDSAPKEQFLDLVFTTPLGQKFHDYETLTGKVDVQIYERKGRLSKWKLVDTLHSDYAGLEYGSSKADALENAFSSQVKLIAP